MNDDIIRTEHLEKSFGDVRAVNDLSFRVKEGELFSFLGVNGAGKSTTINILCGQLGKDGGSVCICGADPEKDSDTVKRSLGVVFQNSVLDRELSVRDNLESRAALYGITGEAFRSRLAELTEMLDMAELLNQYQGFLQSDEEYSDDQYDQMIEWFHSVQDWTVEIGDALNAEFGG